MKAKLIFWGDKSLLPSVSVFIGFLTISPLVFANDTLESYCKTCRHDKLSVIYSLPLPSQNCFFCNDSNLIQWQKLLKLLKSQGGLEFIILAADEVSGSEVRNRMNGRCLVHSHKHGIPRNAVFLCKRGNLIFQHQGNIDMATFRQLVDFIAYYQHT